MEMVGDSENARFATSVAFQKGMIRIDKGNKESRLEWEIFRTFGLSQFSDYGCPT